jgi:hypothetical protein
MSEEPSGSSWKGRLRRLARWLPAGAALALLAAALLVAGCCCGPRVEVPGFRDFEPPAPPPLASPVPPSDAVTKLEIHGTDLRLVDGVVLEVRSLYGEMLANREGEPVVFGDRGSYTVRIFSAEAAMSDRALTAVTAGNFQFLYGGVVRFGQLFMVGTDMQIVDADPSDPFDFYIDLYQSQLVAGYSRSQTDGGLEVFMPDYSEVGREVEPGEKLPAPEVSGPGR